MIFREYVSHLLRQSYVSIRRPNRHRNNNPSETPRLQPEEKHVVEAEAHAARVTIAAILDRPVYRVGGGRGDGTIVYADDGTVLNGVDAAMAKTIAARFLNISEEKLQYTPDPS